MVNIDLAELVLQSGMKISSTVINIRHMATSGTLVGKYYGTVYFIGFVDVEKIVYPTLLKRRRSLDLCS